MTLFLYVGSDLGMYCLGRLGFLPLLAGLCGCDAMMVKTAEGRPFVFLRDFASDI